MLWSQDVGHNAEQDGELIQQVSGLGTKKLKKARQLFPLFKFVNLLILHYFFTRNYL